jgi:molybdopterin molybdotransferase
MAKEFVEFNQAFFKALKKAKATIKTEIIAIDNAVGKVVSSDIKVCKNLPAYNNAALDGFAFRYEDRGKRLKVVKVIYAGDVVEPMLGEGECYKIMTGAKVPDDATSLVAIENAIDFDGDFVTVPSDIPLGFAIRLQGEEAKEGDVCLNKGHRVTSSDIAVLASQGITHIEVFKPLSIAVLSTGSELKEPWENAGDDEIYNCNSYGVVSTLKEMGFDARYIKAIPDNLEQTVEFIHSLKSYDVIITSGGISMGDADFVGQAFEANGFEKIFDGINIKPGKPMMVGVMQDTFVICLPGNPLTTLVNLRLFAMPVLLKLQGANRYYHNIQIAQNTNEFKIKPNRVNIVLGTLHNGKFSATMNNKYGSGMITVVAKSNAMLITNTQKTITRADEYVKIVEFDGMFGDEFIDVLND